MQWFQTAFRFCSWINVDYAIYCLLLTNHRSKFQRVSIMIRPNINTKCDQNRHVSYAEDHVAIISDKMFRFSLTVSWISELDCRRSYFRGTMYSSHKLLMLSVHVSADKHRMSRQIRRLINEVISRHRGRQWYRCYKVMFLCVASRAYSKENFGLHRWRHLWRARNASL